jgi:hypothetical protein
MSNEAGEQHKNRPRALPGRRKCFALQSEASMAPIFSIWRGSERKPKAGATPGRITCQVSGRYSESWKQREG